MTSAPASKKRDRDSASGPCDFVNFIVGGRYFSIRSALIAQHPDSYLSSAMKKEWRGEGDDAINIDRDGSLFEYVVEFHNCGLLPQRKVLLSMETLKAIQYEADFYNIADMVQECNAYLIEQIRKHDHNVHEVTIYNWWDDDPDDGGDDDSIVEKPTPLDTTIREIWSPACFSNYYPPAEADRQVIHDSLVSNIAELTLTADRTDLCKYASINYKQLNWTAVMPIYNLFGHLGCFFTTDVAVRAQPSQLLIVSEGEHMRDALGSSTEQNLAGTLLYILNSDFEGGELVVKHNNKTVAISKQYQFMFVAKGCPYHHEVVKSGTQVLFALKIFYGGKKENYEVLEHIGEDTYLWEDVEPLSKDTEFVSYRMLAGIARPLPVRARNKIYSELTAHLAKHDAVVISLTRYYPILQCTADCFTHGDGVLYALINEYLQSEVGSSFEMSMWVVGIEYHVNTDAETCCVAYGSVKDLTFLPCTNAHTKEHVKLIIPKLCHSNERFKTTTENSSEGPLEGTEHLFLGLKIAKRRDRELW